jgi:hypothetical protein
MSVDIDRLFGDRTWDDVRGKVHARLRAKWPSASRTDIEDAVSVGLCDLMGNWLDMPSTVKAIESGDTEKVFAFAVKFGEHRANDYLAARVYDDNAPLSLSTVEDNPYGDGSHNNEYGSAPRSWDGVSRKRAPINERLLYDPFGEPTEEERYQALANRLVAKYGLERLGDESAWKD